MSRVAITESDVLAAVVPGRHAIINLTHAQRELLCAAPEGPKALALLQHLVYARVTLGADGPMPLTEGFVLRLGQRLDLGLGRNAVRRSVRALEDACVIVRANTYRQAYPNTAGSRGFRVVLWSVGPVCWVGSRVWRCAEPGRLRSATSTASVATRAYVKAKPWWQHPLFGNPGGSEPKNTPSPHRVKDWRSQKYFCGEVRRERAWLRGGTASGSEAGT